MPENIDSFIRGRELFERYPTIKTFQDAISKLKAPVVLLPLQEDEILHYAENVAPTVILIPDKDKLSLESFKRGVVEVNVNDVMEAARMVNEVAPSLRNTGIMVIWEDEIYYMGDEGEQDAVMPVVYKINRDPQNNLLAPEICHCETGKEARIFWLVHVQVTQFFRQRPQY